MISIIKKYLISSYRGDGNLYVILILFGVVGVSFLLADGIIPNIKPSDQLYEKVATVYQPEGYSDDNIQLNNIGFDPKSVTVIPSPTRADLTPTAEESQESETILALIPTTIVPTSITAEINPTNTPSPTTGNIVPTSGTVTSPITSTPTRTPTPTNKPTPTSTGIVPLTSFQKKLLAIARSQKGEPYGMGACQDWASSSRRPGDPPVKSDACSKWDCSNWAAWVYYWATSGKIKMVSQTCSDYGQCYAKYGGFTNYKSHDTSIFTKYTYKDRDKLQFGDLVYFGSRESLPEISHVGLYIGVYGNCGASDCIIDSSASGHGVSERSLAKVPKTLVGFLRPKI